VAWRAARFTARANPRLVSETISFTWGQLAAICSAVPSPEALSTTTTSTSSVTPAYSDFRQSSISSGVR
jgi:hypothetical protein